MFFFQKGLDLANRFTGPEIDPDDRFKYLGKGTDPSLFDSQLPSTSAIPDSSTSAIPDYLTPIPDANPLPLSSAIPGSSTSAPDPNPVASSSAIPDVSSQTQGITLGDYEDSTDSDNSDRVPKKKGKIEEPDPPNMV